MKTTSTILDQILVDVRRELAEAQRRLPAAELEKRIADAPPVRPFAAALRQSFGLIAEIKERSPSHGPMRPQNVADAPAAYDRSPIVRALSVLTNQTHFGMRMEQLQQIKLATSKPVLRKDFIFDEYQVWEARAFGADAILLMANLLDADEMQRLYRLARELNMDALFECHTREQIAQVPSDAAVLGINSRTFDTRGNTFGVGRYALSSLLGRLGTDKDLTIDQNRFQLGLSLPAHVIKVAESGVYPATVAEIRDQLGYHAALVGTSLLAASHGVARELEQFAAALNCTAPELPSTTAYPVRS